MERADSSPSHLSEKPCQGGSPAAPDSMPLRWMLPRNAALRPALLRDAVQAQLQCSTSWSRLPLPAESASKQLSKVELQLQRAASLPSLQKRMPAKPAAPVKKLMPFQASHWPVTAEAWAPHLGARAKRAEVQMQQRLRG